MAAIERDPQTGMPMPAAAVQHEKDQAAKRAAEPKMVAGTVGTGATLRTEMVPENSGYAAAKNSPALTAPAPESAPTSPAISPPAAATTPVAPATARPAAAEKGPIAAASKAIVQETLTKMFGAGNQGVQGGPTFVGAGRRSIDSSFSPNSYDPSALSQSVLGQLPRNAAGNIEARFLSKNDYSANGANNLRALEANGLSGGLPRNLQGMTYDQQVAKAQEVNAANERFNAINMSPRERAAFENMSNTKMGSFTRSGAAAEVEAFKARRDAYLGKEKNDQALALRKQQSDDRKYAADQALSGHKMTADATRYKADRDAEGDKLKVDAAIKTGKDSQRSDSIKALSTSIEQKTKALEGIVDPKKRETAMAALEKDHARLAKLAGFEEDKAGAGKQLTPDIAKQYAAKYKTKAEAEAAAKKDGYTWG